MKAAKGNPKTGNAFVDAMFCQEGPVKLIVAPADTPPLVGEVSITVYPAAIRGEGRYTLGVAPRLVLELVPYSAEDHCPDTNMETSLSLALRRLDGAEVDIQQARAKLLAVQGEVG